MRKSGLTLLLAAAATAAIVVSPAEAKPRHHAVPQGQFNQLQAPQQGTNPANDPTGVYRNGVLVGRDPDPAIRAEIGAYYGHGGAP